MKSSVFGVGSLVLLAIAGFVGVNSLFTVDETEQVIVLQFGEPKATYTEPGLKFKVPFLQNVRYYDKRVLNFDPNIERFILADQEPINVDYYIRYRIADPLQYFKSVSTETRAEAILLSTTNAKMRSSLGNIVLDVLLSEERSDILNAISDATNEDTKSRGIEILDVRIGKADLPNETSERVYERMRSERQEIATATRAEGTRIATETRANAQQEVTVIKAKANRTAEILRGEGEAARTTILNQAYGADPEFYNFIRSLEAYQESLARQTQPMILTTDHDFLKGFETFQPQSTPAQ